LLARQFTTATAYCVSILCYYYISSQLIFSPLMITNLGTNTAYTNRMDNTLGIGYLATPKRVDL